MCDNLGMPGIGSSKDLPSEFTKEIASIVDSWRVRRGLKQKDLELPLGVSKGQVSRLLKGLKHWDIEQLDNVCAFLGVSVLEVISEAESALVGRKLYPHYAKTAIVSTFPQTVISDEVEPLPERLVASDDDDHGGEIDGDQTDG